MKMFSCVGRCTYGDLGGMATFMRFVTFVLPFDFLAGLFSYWAPLMGDYAKNNANRGKLQKLPSASAAPKTKEAAASPAASKRSRSGSRGRGKK